MTGRDTSERAISVGRRERAVSLLGVLLAWMIAGAYGGRDGCDLTIESSHDLPKNGTIRSPNYPSNYDDNMRCIYMFVAAPGERVQIVFTEFQVKGVPPMCVHDYVDVYTQVRDPEEDLLDVPLHGRYCGSDLEILPHKLISMGTILVIGFYTDDERTEKGFEVDYKFIDGSVYTVGTPAPPNVCGQTIRVESMPRGTLLSPTYPGMYPDNIFCYYKLQGRPGDRIHFTFNDLDLYSGGEHCPFDYVKIYDGFTNQDEVIGTYCGKLKNFDLFSTGEAMHIEFVTKSGRVEPTKKPYVPYWEIEEESKIHRRGFKATFEISNHFVDLSFIKEGQHVRGTECDQRVFSYGESNGTIISPNYPNSYPLNIVCKYYIDGLVDRQNLEKAKLQFDTFDIPKAGDSCYAGNMSAYTRGQDIMKEQADMVFCGKDPPNIQTTNPRLLLLFDTRDAKVGRGFKASYQFVTDYAIPGTPASETGCHFIYNSGRNRKWGSFNSPRHPSNYPLNTICTYEFHGLNQEQIRVTFENFLLEKNCSQDYLEIFSVKMIGGEEKHRNLIGHFCGELNPGPIVSDTSHLLVRLITDGENYAIGFRAKYEFIERKPMSKRCSANITSTEMIGGGLILSPNHPHKYSKNTTCDHIIYAKKPGGKIMLQFHSFGMEGNLEQQGCEHAVLKVYTGDSDLPEHNLCGAKKELPEQIISQGNYIRLKFISSANAIGGKGYKITWTEIMPQTADGYCQGFLCQTSHYCISQHLICNALPNCGANDASDEQKTKCGPAYSDHGILHIILGVVISLIILVFIIVCILHRRRKIRKKKNKKEIEVRYVTRNATYSAANKNDVRDYTDGRTTGSLLQERTEKVSIV